MIYKTVIKADKKMGNDRHIANATNKTKAMWQVINKEAGKNPQNEQEMELKCGVKKVTNPRDIAELFNSYFAEIAEKLIKQNDKNKSLYQMSTKINSYNATMFIFPATETEIEEVIKNFQGKHSAGTDEIPDYVIKKCIEEIKNPLAHLCDASMKCGIFPDRFKIAKVKPLYKKRG
jgi:hypothetical protein